MFGFHTVPVFICLGLMTILGIRALVVSENDEGRLAGAALMALSIVVVAWIVASR